MKERELPISVVIATLGGDVLKTTILHINQGDSVPAEILLCIPESEAAHADCVAFIENVFIIKTSCRGQVAQRAVGLGMTAYPYVMQLDDDVILLPDTLNVLYKTLLVKGKKNIVAPFLRLQSTGADGTTYLKGLPGLLRDCHACLVCGARFGRKRSGTISLSGVAFGVSMNSSATRFIQSEWLPGGVVMCHKADLITHDYYPFSGKAFSEDLIHSILWRKQGCSLWTIVDVAAMVDVTIESMDWRSVISRYKAHAYVAYLLGGSIWRTRLWLAVYSLFKLRQLIAQNFL